MLVEEFSMQAMLRAGRCDLFLLNVGEGLPDTLE
jgi:hypothetical protein